MPFAPPNLLISLESLGSNPTLSAMLLKLQQLSWIFNPLSGMCLLLGVSDMQL